MPRIINLDCPECTADEALRFSVEYDPDDQDYHARLEDQECDCELTETQMQSLTNDACERWIESDD
jgi:hypothetical protein